MAEIKYKTALIKNAKSSSDRRARKLVLNSLDAALKAAEPIDIVKSKVALKENLLKVDGKTFNLRDFKDIYVVGGGKASGLMAEAIEGILGDHITDGTLNVPHETLEQYKTKRIKLRGASHPIPDKAGIEGTRRILDLVDQADERDLVVCLVSGGGSSLMSLPRSGISLPDMKDITEDLLKCGATINEINTVRKHISDFKGGWLAKRAYPATVISLLLSDVVGDPLDVIASGPTVPDSTTFLGAIEVLKKYGLWDKTPSSVRKVLLDGEKGLISETPKPGDAAFQRVRTFVVGNNRTASLAACHKLRNAGLNTLFLTSSMEGEARNVGAMLASLAKEISASGNPVPKPAAIVVGGETTVTVVGKGKGGRNQEIALGAALKMGGLEGAVVASLDTDGIDGPTDATGALADGKTLLRSRKMGLKAEEFLMTNDSYTFFSKLGDLMFTGPTGTNVNDVSIVVVT